MSAPLQVARTRRELDAALEALRAGGGTLALVPTMGYLHPGHLSLLERAAAEADHTALSIFVNPLQFGHGEDLDRYPRSEAEDLARAASLGAQLAFVPDSGEMYPFGPPTIRVVPGPLGERLCGLHRPGHFQGVLTVVARLFGLFRPEVAVFGRKDFQQAVLVRRMVRDLEMRVRVEVAPLVREADGLAMSSRNAYLTPEERSAAPALFQALEEAEAAFRAGERRRSVLADRVRARMEGEPLFRLEYSEVVDPETLDAHGEAAPGNVVAVAAWLGSTRLIDNRVLGAEVPDPVGFHAPVDPTAGGPPSDPVAPASPGSGPPAGKSPP
ncbi:MAG: pantoate--beta-alanine ligase [Gemmatimonadales bacterium]|nr:MAG: pantoate--beta-alanine ligase [Gemmatimonadales bacterium]